MTHKHSSRQLSPNGWDCDWVSVMHTSCGLENTRGKRYGGSKAGIDHSFIIITFTFTFRTSIKCKFVCIALHCNYCSLYREFQEARNTSTVGALLLFSCYLNRWELNYSFDARLLTVLLCTLLPAVQNHGQHSQTLGWIALALTVLYSVLKHLHDCSLVLKNTCISSQLEGAHHHDWQIYRYICDDDPLVARCLF